MHHLYGILHLPKNDMLGFLPQVMDVLYFYSVGFAFLCVCLSIFCLIKKQFIIGTLALIISVVALGNGIGRF